MLAALLPLGLPTGDAQALVPVVSPAPVEGNATNTLALYDFKAGNKVLYAISTCQAYHGTRAAAVHSTWCKHIESCVFYSDHETEKTPATIKIAIENGKGAGLDGLRRAQMRYIRILHHAQDMILRNHDGKFGRTKWAVICDDDSYIFHHNMVSYLSGLNHDKAIYTGHTLKSSAYPVDSDGEGHTLNKKITTHFACGGGGSVFSLGALHKLKMDECVRQSLPGGKMWEWQSDWMMGECSHESGVTLLQQPADRFGQFLYKTSGFPPDHLLVDDPEPKKYFCELEHGKCHKPLSIHPVKEPKGAHAIFDRHSNSAKSEITGIKPVLHKDGSITFG